MARKAVRAHHADCQQCGEKWCYERCAVHRNISCIDSLMNPKKLKVFTDDIRCSRTGLVCAIETFASTLRYSARLP